MTPTMSNRRQRRVRGSERVGGEDTWREDVLIEETRVMDVDAPTSTPTLAQG